MKYLETISVITYGMGLVTLVSGILLNFVLDALSYYFSNTEIIITFILFIIFIVVGIITKIMSKSQ